MIDDPCVAGPGHSVLSYEVRVPPSNCEQILSFAREECDILQLWSDLIAIRELQKTFAEYVPQLEQQPPLRNPLWRQGSWRI